MAKASSIVIVLKSRCTAAAAFSFTPEKSLLFVLAWLLAGCLSQEESRDAYQLSGKTMGTYYRITLPTHSIPNSDTSANSINTVSLRAGIEAVMLAINNAMSTYLVSSEINQWNGLSPGECLTASPQLFEVVTAARKIAEASGFRFNPLVAPLVNRWGFGSENKPFVFPESEEITVLLGAIDPSHLVLHQNKSEICKADNANASKAKLDLSAIAKGYAVDQVSHYLSTQGFTDFLVDIGGEVRVAGLNPGKKRWRLAIEQPNQVLQTIYQLIRLTDIAIATSGDYRNYFEYEGQHFSHTIDPVTGYPITHTVTSVTVVADSAMIADAWATALLVAGAKKTRKLAEQQNLAVYLNKR